MRADHGPEHHGAFGEDGHEGCQVGQVAAAEIRVVEQEHVAGRRVRERLDDCQRGPGHRADMHGDVVGLRHQPPRAQKGDAVGQSIGFIEVVGHHENGRASGAQPVQRLGEGQPLAAAGQPQHRHPGER